MECPSITYSKLEENCKQQKAGIEASLNLVHIRETVTGNYKQ